MNPTDEQGRADRDKRNTLAKRLTEEAYCRTQLASERTFSAWVRTGLALLVAGFAATRLLEETGPAWLISLVGATLVLLGTVVFAVAYWSYHKANIPGVSTLSRAMVRLIAILLIVLSAVAVFLLINAPFGK
jgi:putative membrane protein